MIEPIIGFILRMLAYIKKQPLYSLVSYLENGRLKYRHVELHTNRFGTETAL
jgi:hypothetical protein